MGFVSAFLRLTRFDHAIMLVIAVLIGEAVALGALPRFSVLVLLSLLVPLFSETGSFALNDYLDIESDKINQRADRPLARGEIGPQFAFRFSLAAIALSVILAYFINIYAFAIALVFNLLAIAYNYGLKDLPLVGNAYIGLSMAIPFAFGSAVMLNSFNFSPTIIILSAIAFLAGLAREIIKSIQDMEGDRKARKSKTLPILIGEKKALYAACLLYLVFIPLTALPFSYGLRFDYFSAGLIVSADVGILLTLYLLLKNPTAARFKISRNLSLLCLFMGLVAYLIAAIG